jgi:PAS domain S-box-containing protein
MEWDLTVHLLPIVAGIFLSVTFLYVIQRADSKGTTYLFWMMIGSIGWSLVYIVQLTTRYRELILLIDPLVITFVPITAISWFLFALEYTGYGDWQRREVRGIIVVPSIVTYVLLFTNDYHMLFWSEYLVKYDAETGLLLPDSTIGIWFAVHTAHMYLLEVIAVVLIVREALNNWSVYRLQAIVMIVATLPVMISNFLFVTKITAVDYTSTALAFTAAGFTWGLYRHELFDLVPVARDTVLEEMRDAVIVIDNKGRIIDLNDSVDEIIEDDDEIIGKAATEVLPFELLETDGGIQRANREVTLRNGNSEEHYKLQSTRMTGTNDEHVGTVLVLQDVTELKRRERELQRTNQELEQTNEELEILNRIVRHDIQNDMNVVQGHAQLVETLLDAEDQDAIEPVLHNTQHAIELTETVRDLITAATGEEDLEMEPVDLIDLLQQEIERARIAHEEATFELEVPQQHDRIQVWGTMMLSSVITNLRSNAVRHNDTDDPEITVSVDVDQEAVTIRVADNGPGVPADKRDEIFGRGEKGLDSPGSGIGLYLVDTLVEEFGGSVHVEDNKPRGAVFVIELRRVTEGKYR